MENAKRRPGRPKGSELDDRSTLARIAAMRIDEPEISVATALKRIVGGRVGDAHVRRIQSKWRLRGAAALAVEAARRSPTATGGAVRSPSGAEPSRRPSTRTDPVAAAARRMDALLGGSPCDDGDPAAAAARSFRRAFEEATRRMDEMLGLRPRRIARPTVRPAAGGPPGSLGAIGRTLRLHGEAVRRLAHGG